VVRITCGNTSLRTTNVVELLTNFGVTIGGGRAKRNHSSKKALVGELNRITGVAWLKKADAPRKGKKVWVSSMDCRVP